MTCNLSKAFTLIGVCSSVYVFLLLHLGNLQRHSWLYLLKTLYITFPYIHVDTLLNFHKESKQNFKMIKPVLTTIAPQITYNNMFIMTIIRMI